MGYLQILKILFLEEFKHLRINTFFHVAPSKKKNYIFINLLDQKVKSHEFIENKTFTDFQNVVLQTKSNMVTETSILYSLFLFVFVVLFFVFAFYLRF